jgi:hypothetical protein
VVLVVLNQLENRRIARAGESGQTPVRDILGGRKRRGPEELEPIESGERPAA